MQRHTKSVGSELHFIIHHHHRPRRCLLRSLLLLLLLRGVPRSSSALRVVFSPSLSWFSLAVAPPAMPTDGESSSSSPSGPLTIQALDASGAQQPTTFRVRYNTKMHKLMGAYAMSQNLSLTQLVFTYEGRPIEPFQTPHELGMPAECCIIVHDHSAANVTAEPSPDLTDIKLPPRPVRPQQRPSTPDSSPQQLVGGGVNSPTRGRDTSSVRQNQLRRHTMAPQTSSPLSLTPKKAAARVPQDLSGQEMQRHKVRWAPPPPLEECMCMCIHRIR